MTREWCYITIRRIAAVVRQAGAWRSQGSLFQAKLTPETLVWFISNERHAGFSELPKDYPFSSAYAETRGIKNRWERQAPAWPHVAQREHGPRNSSRAGASRRTFGDLFNSSNSA